MRAARTSASTLAWLAAFATVLPLAAPADFAAATVSTVAADTLALTTPPGTVVHDVLLADIVVMRGATVTAPAGWALLDSVTTGTLNGDIAQHVYQRTATASETTPYTWTSTRKMAGSILAYRGIDTLQPIDAIASLANAKANGINLPAITTTEPNAVLLGLLAADDGRSAPIGSAAGFTTRAVFNGANNEFAFTAQDALIAAPSTVAASSVTSGTSAKSVATLVALRPPTVGFDAAASSAFESVGTVEFTVRLSSPVSLSTSVDYALTAGTAVANEDYAFTAGTLVFPPGSTTATISLSVLDDSGPDGGATSRDETLEVSLARPTNANLGAITTHMFTIRDDEPKLGLGLVDAAGTDRGAATWGEWVAEPGATDVNATGFVRIENVSPDPAVRPVVTIDFSGPRFTGVTDASHVVAIDDNVRFACVEDATGAAAPKDLAGFAFASASATGAITMTFAGSSATNSVLYCTYQVVQIPPYALDQAYQAGYTVNAP